MNLEWNSIVPASEGGYCMRIRTEKTETETTLPLSDEAMELCGKPGDGKVFKRVTEIHDSPTFEKLD